MTELHTRITIFYAGRFYYIDGAPPDAADILFSELLTWAAHTKSPYPFAFTDEVIFTDD